MKNILIISTILVSSLNVWSAIQSPRSVSGTEWVQLQNEIKPALLIIKNVSVGTTICEEATGKNYFTLPADQKESAVVVSCLQVNTMDIETKNALDILFPLGTKIKDIFITTRFVGQVIGH